MKYAVHLLLLAVSLYPLSYARYNWNKKNRFGAVGVVLLVLASIILPSVMLLTR